jgi:hypothetical protein
MTPPWRAVAEFLTQLGRKEPLLAATVAVVMAVVYAVTQHPGWPQVLVVGTVTVLVFSVGTAAYVRIAGVRRGPGRVDRPEQSVDLGGLNREVDVDQERDDSAGQSVKLRGASWGVRVRQRSRSDREKPRSGGD